MATGDQLPAISEETREMLESQVKKGKPRKFFLVYRGSVIKTLVVFKKGPFGPKIMKARKEGFKGDVAYGIVTGSGRNLFFQLPASGDVAAAMKVDSWEEQPPTKRTKLREFLIDNGLNFKPTYQMVTQVGEAPNPDSDEAQIPEAPPTVEATPDASNDGTASVDSEASESADPVVDSGEQLRQFRDRCGDIEPRLLEAQRADRDRATKLMAVWDYAQNQAGDGNVNQALQALDRLEVAIKDCLENASQGPEGLGIETGIVAKRKFLVTRFQQIPLEIKPHLEAVKLSAIEQEADEDPDQLIDAIQQGLEAFYAELQDEIDSSIQNGDSGDLRGLRDRVVQHPLVRELVRCPLVDGTNFQTAILSALDEVEQQLAG